MATILNPLTNRPVKESGQIGSIIKNIRDWSDIDNVQLNAYRMFKQYRCKSKNNWKNDFLTIVQHYLPEKTEQAVSIINSIIQQESERIANIRSNFDFDFEYDSYFFSQFGLINEINEEQQVNKPTSDKQKKKLNKFLQSSIIEQKQCECSICLNFDECEEKIVELKCKHKFHHHCISQWVSKVNSCPMCKNQCIE